MSAIEGLAEDIAGHGVGMTFGVPGGGASLSLIDALEKHDIPFHLTHFEGAGALMAATVGRLSGRAGLSLSIKGPGVANAVPGLAAAWFEGFPLVHVAEAFAPGSSPSQAHKRLDQRALVAPVVKAVGAVGKDGSAFETMARLALAEVPGPVVLECAGDVAELEPHPERDVAIEGSAAPAVAVVRGAERPVVVAGTLAIRLRLGEALAKLPCPVFSTAAAKGAVDEMAANAAGVFSGVGLGCTPELTLLRDADVVVGIGVTAREVLATRPFHCPYVSVEAVETPGTDAFAPHLRVAASEASLILDTLAEKSAWGIDALRGILRRLRLRMTAGFLPGAVFEVLEEHFRRRVRLVMDTGYFCTIGEHAWRAPSNDWCLLSGQGRYMGTGLPMAIGAALYDRSVPTLAVLGDGSVGMYLAEAKLAVAHRLPLLIVLMTDNAFGSIRTRALQAGLTQKPLTMDGRSWVPVFDALGIPGTRAESLGAVTAALSAWDPAGGPAFLEIPFAPDAYEAMVRDIR